MYNINGWVNKKFIVWIPEALLGNSLNFLAPSTSGKSSPSFCPSNAYPFFLSIVLSSCLKLHVNHNGNSCFLHCKPKFKEKVWCVCEWMMYICMWYMLTSHVWEHDFLCGWMPKENTGALVCHCHPYSSEQVFHWRWNWGGRFLLSALHSAGVIIMHCHAQISLCGSWDLKAGLCACEAMWSIQTHWASSPAPKRTI